MQRPKKKNEPDPMGLAIAQAVQDNMPGARVILFGSRARGDQKANSDTDLLIIIPDDANRTDWQTQARWNAAQEREQLGTQTGCDISIMTQTEFKINRLAARHVAGRAAAYGVDMTGERLNYQDHRENDEEYIEGYDAEAEEEATTERIVASYSHENTEGQTANYPTHWPETRVRIENALDWLDEFNERVENNSPRQKILGFAGQQAFENALKAWLSSYNEQRDWGHEFGTLWADIKKEETHTSPQFIQVREKVDSLLDATSYADSRNPARTQNWLELYAVTYRYGGTNHVMTPEEKKNLQEKLNEAINATLEHIHRRSGTTANDVPRSNAP